MTHRGLGPHLHSGCVSFYVISLFLYCYDTRTPVSSGLVFSVYSVGSWEVEDLLSSCCSYEVVMGKETLEDLSYQSTTPTQESSALIA